MELHGKNFISGGFMNRSNKQILFLLMVLFSTISCSQKEAPQITELKSYPADDLSGVVNLSHVTLDTMNKFEGSGSLKIDTEKPRVMKLYETGDLEAENCRIAYQAQLKSAGHQGEAYLEMWCHFPGKGEFFSRGLHSKISGDTGWSSHETIFTLSEKENPDNIKLNLVVNGSGTVWIDDIRLKKIPIE